MEFTLSQEAERKVEFDMNSTRPLAHSPLDYAIDIYNLSKSFKRKTIRGGYTTLKSSLMGLFSFGKRPAVRANCTTAVSDLTIRIPFGASVGVIGRNGSGKSSLLKLITGIYKPDTGSIKVNGRLAALIELGAGFHPDFSGRENVFLGGMMYGLTKKEVEERFEQIVHFAELEEVIDDPVRTYSSGMFMRLGFSLAIHTDPDVLLVDEVLAVGDAAFTAKCKDHLALMRQRGKTLILVSHDLEAVERWCDEVVWLDRGVARERGEPRRVIDAYRTFIEKREEDELLEEAVQQQISPNVAVGGDEANQKQRWGSREIEIANLRLLDAAGDVRALFHPESKVRLEIDYQINDRSPLSKLVFGIAISRSDGVLIHGTNTQIERLVLPSLKTRGTLVYELERLGLTDGVYYIDLAVHREDGYPYDYHKNMQQFTVRTHDKHQGAFIPEHKWFVDGLELGAAQLDSRISSSEGSLGNA